MSQHGFGLDRIVPYFPCSNYIVKSSEILEMFVLYRSDGRVPGGETFTS